MFFILEYSFCVSKRKYTKIMPNQCNDAGNVDKKDYQGECSDGKATSGEIRKLGNEKMRKWISGENSSLICRISETGRIRVLNKWNLWDEFEGLILGRSFDNGCGKQTDNQGQYYI